MHQQKAVYVVSTGSVEIPQAHPTQPIGFSVPVEHTLNEELGFSIGSNRSFRMLFIDWKMLNCLATRLAM
jgi:hypothetical protein